MANIFCSLYTRRDILICKLPNQDRWRKWTGPLEDHQILGVIADGGRGILRGCYWAEQTHHAVLDIDARSKYHNAQELGKLQQKLAAVGLSVTPYRSSESGGWHLYIFFDAWAECSEVENSIKAWLKYQGYEIKSGTLEIFPSGNALRLPLQPGFAWLDQEGNLIRMREEIRRDEALASFIFDLERNQRNWSEAQNRIESQLQAAAAVAGGSAQAHEEAVSGRGFERLFNAGKIQELWERGREWWQEGLSAAGERHDAVLAIGHYLWYGDEENDVDALPGARHDAYRERLIEEWLRQKHNGYCRHIDQNKWEEIRAQIKRATAWRRDGKYKDRTPYPLTERLLKRLLAHYRKTGKVWTVTEYEQANIDRMTDARERIKAAILELEERGELLTVSAVAREAGASRNTVKRHRDLFACWSGEYNRGGGGGSVLSGGSCSGSEKKVLLVLDQGDSRDLDSASGSCSGELAPIILTPPFLLPGNEPTSEPPASRPSPAGSFGSLDAGALVRWYSGRTADGVGGLEPSCNEAGSTEVPAESMDGGTSSPPGPLAVAEIGRVPATVLPFGIMGGQAGLMVVTTCHPPAHFFADVIAVHTDSVSNSGLIRTAHLPLKVADRRCTQLQSKAFRFFVYGDVRGPPSCTRLIWCGAPIIRQPSGTIFGDVLRQCAMPKSPVGASVHRIDSD